MTESIVWPQRPLTRRQALLGLAGLLAGCGGTSTRRDAARPVQRPPERPIAAAFSRRHGGLVPRTVLECPAGDCILVHFPIREGFRPDAMTDLLGGRPETVADDGELVENPTGQWPSATSSRLCQFNCCAYAVAPSVGLGPADWLCGEVGELTDGSNPMQVVLESYYKTVASFDPPFTEASIERFATDADLQEDDVVCLVGSRGPEYPHAARLRRRDGRNWVEGKFGEDPVLWTPLETVGGVYEGQFDRVEVFRLQPAAS